MSQPVKLSDSIVLDARITGDAMERSIAGQVEFWARLGRSVDSLLEGQEVLKLARNAGAQRLSACLESVDSPAGRTRVEAYLQSQPFPHYRAHLSKPGYLERVEEDGTVAVGRFVNREFQPIGNAPRNAAE
jgi:hypothetical protein